jgi:mono/diheme cytochrome c family protein
MTGNWKHKLVTLMFYFLLFAVACSPRRSEPISGKPVKKDARIEHGMKVYMIHCQKCHPNGEAGLGPALNNKPVPGFIKRFQVRHGLGVMPSFKKDEISRRDLRDMTKYMKALKHR